MFLALPELHDYISIAHSVDKSSKKRISNVGRLRLLSTYGQAAHGSAPPVKM